MAKLSSSSKNLSSHLSLYSWVSQTEVRLFNQRLGESVSSYESSWSSCVSVQFLAVHQGFYRFSKIFPYRFRDGKLISPTWGAKPLNTMKPQGTALEMMVLHALNLSVSTLSAATHQDHPAPCHPRALNSIPGAASPPQHGGRLSPSYRKALENGRLIRWHMTLSNISFSSQHQNMESSMDWFVGENLNRKPMGFYMFLPSNIGLSG